MNKNKYIKYGLTISLIVVSLIMLKNAWVSDDAYITFRTVDNFVNGYGPVRNISERVQAYTHPLWFIIMSFFYVFSGEVFFTSIVLSLVLSITAIYILTFKIGKTAGTTFLGIAILILSSAFMDFTTSGLENALNYLLVALFVLIFLQNKNTHRWLFTLTLTASLGTLNRIDTILLYLPALALAFYSAPDKRKALLYASLGTLPFIAWEIFSLIYYGYPFPNTAYAKLATGIAQTDLLTQGIYYYVDSLSRDAITLLTIAVTGLLVIFKKNIRLIALMTGVFLYLIYVLKIGGDFMAGRFFSLPLFTSMAVLLSTKWRVPRGISITLVSLITLYSLINPVSPIHQISDNPRKIIGKKGIVDERAFYAEDLKLSNNNPVAATTVGMVGYFAGPTVHFLDTLGLGDPLLSRLPLSEKRPMAEVKEGWRIGHFRRDITGGYIESLTSGKNLIKDEKIHDYYKKVLVITRGEIFSVDRFKTIIKMNTGKYEKLLGS